MKRQKGEGSAGGIGVVVGLLLGAFFAALLEDYFDQNSS